MAQITKTKGPSFILDWRFQEPVAWRDTDLDEKTLREWFRYMLLGRQIDYRFQVLNRQGRAPFIISCAGHEAAQIGVGWPLKPKHDWLAPYYRDVVLCMRMGMTPLDLMLAVLAKSGDPSSGGKQTPGHFSDSRLNITSGGSPVATQMVRGAGVAYTLKMDGTDKVLMTCYGEGAGAEGDAHEAFNFAAIYKLPEVFVCENNGFAISTPFQKEYAIQHVAQRAAGYGFPGVTVDGRDPVTCYAVAKEAVAQARAGGGPTLIECLVDRLGAHSSEDDQRRYRTQEEIDKLAESDCLERFKKRLIEEGVLTAKQVTELEEGVKEEVTTTTKAGMDAADPQPEDALTNVYAVEAPKAIEPASGAEIQFTDFAHMAFNSITNEIAKYRYRSDGDWSVPLVVRAPMGGHAHGALYHSQSIEARFATPGLKIVIPSTPYEAKGLLLAAIRDPDPVLFFEHKRLYRMFKEAVPKGEYLIPLQVARTARDGTDISVFCYGLMVHYAMEAAKNLEADGVSVEIVDLRTVYPLDKEAILASARKTGKCLVLYEDNFSVSVGSEVAAIIADEAWRWLDAPVKRFGGLDGPSLPYANPMEEDFMATPDKITKVLKDLAAF